MAAIVIAKDRGLTIFATTRQEAKRAALVTNGADQDTYPPACLRLSAQHALWAVLWTCRYCAPMRSPGSAILQAGRWTTVGIVIGVGPILAIGTNEPVLWAHVPLAILRRRRSVEPTELGLDRGLLEIRGPLRPF